MSTTFFRAEDGPQTGLFSLSPGGVRSILSVSKLTNPVTGANQLCAIITNHPIEEAVNANLMYAADGHIYMNVFGDKIGSIVISGTAFTQPCPTPNIGTSGFTRTLRWYRRNRISLPANNLPIEIVVGNSNEDVLYGYPGSFTGSVIDANNRLYSFSFPMYLVPAGGIAYA